MHFYYYLLDLGRRDFTALFSVDCRTTLLSEISPIVLTACSVKQNNYTSVGVNRLQGILFAIVYKLIIDTELQMCFL